MQVPRAMLPAGVLILALSVTAGVAGGPVPETAAERPADAAAIRDHIDSIFRAYIAKDREAIRRTHGEDWRGFLSRSTSVIRGIDEYMETAERALGAPGFSDYEFVDYDVIFYGETAVVSYVAALKLRALPFRPEIRVVDVYARLDGHWIQVASQTAQHPDTLAAARQLPSPVEPVRDEILEAREAVWRSWFENAAGLGDLIPAETVAISGDQEEWDGRAEILEGSAEFVAGGGRLVRLEFPRTEIQIYGDVAVLYTVYDFTTERDGSSRRVTGRGTEIFVHRGGRWVNPGWHLDRGPASD